MQHRKTVLLSVLASFLFTGPSCGAQERILTPAFGVGADFILSPDMTIWMSTNVEPAVRRAAVDLSADIARVNDGTGKAFEDTNTVILIGTIGNNKNIDQLIAERRLDVHGVRGEWESYVLQIVKKPFPGIDKALVIAGSDRRGTIYGIYQVSEMIGVSPWNWWADVPVAKKSCVGLSGDIFGQGPPAVKYRGIFLNDEDWGLRPWASKTFEPENGNIGPKTYEKLFELLLRLRANFLWPAMHPGTVAFNQFATNKFLADEYGIVMGSSHCEQMLRNNVSEWDTNTFGQYNFVTNPDGVLKYWEQRVRENGKFENVYTLGMRGIHDGAMPGGGTEQEKAGRLQTIIADQRQMLARLVNTNVAQVPQIFCPYKEVLPLYRRMTNVPDDITLVWPDDNYGYIRQFSDAKERARSGGAGVYYHVSYYGRPRDYLWLCSTPPALIAEEMTKAFDYGANKVWLLNVGDLKPSEIDTEFFLKLAWNPHAWNGMNTYELLKPQLARDFGTLNAVELTAILTEYYRLNIPRKPEHIGYPNNNLFTADEAAQRLDEWHALIARVDWVSAALPPESRDSFFEMIGYPVSCAALANERALSPATAREAQDQIHKLTFTYNTQIANGKWRNMMSDNPRGLLEVKSFPTNQPSPSAAHTNIEAAVITAEALQSGAKFLENNHMFVAEAEHASDLIPGKDAHWQKIVGLGYNGEAVTIFPTTAAVRSTTNAILAESPCLQYTVWISNPGDWQVTVRALPTFSVDTGKPQRYAIAFEDEPPQIVSLPLSQDEQNKTWGDNVLRNAATTTSTHTLAQPGLHTLKIWMVDPGIVLDTIIGHSDGAADLGYTWPPESLIHKP